MPLFEFRCPSCHNDFELLVRAQDVPACPSCGTDRVEKLLSAAAVPNMNSLGSLPIASDCATQSGPPCRPNCCRL